MSNETYCPQSEAEHKQDIMNESLLNDINRLKDPMDFYTYMLDGLMVQAPDDTDIPVDSYTALEGKSYIQEYMFEKMTEFKENWYRKKHQAGKGSLKSEPTAENILNTIRMQNATLYKE